MKRIIQIEELAMTAAAIYLIGQLDISLSWWLYLLLFFSPDLGMLGYVVNTKIGAITYNLFHHRGIAIVIATVGIMIVSQYVLLAGLLLFAHASFDRIFGFGLKYFTSFKHTHLGVMK
ncbi:MAG: DUF4260 domain-containing protein [Taibaiella sp.]|nr:DUF4260 domain-containing protein [Taibaiella sp.]